MPGGAVPCNVVTLWSLKYRKANTTKTNARRVCDIHRQTSLLPPAWYFRGCAPCGIPCKHVLGGQLRPTWPRHLAGCVHSHHWLPTDAPNTRAATLHPRPVFCQYTGSSPPLKACVREWSTLHPLPVLNAGKEVHCPQQHCYTRSKCTMWKVTIIS